MKFSHIVACAEGNVIGVAGQLPWHIPEDLKLFRRITTGHIVIMGRKTFDSLRKPLKERLIVVISRDGENFPEHVHHVRSLEDAFRFCKHFAGLWGDEAFIIGGGQIYKQSLPFVDRIYMSQLPFALTGDTWYPEVDLTIFSAVSQEEIAGKTPFNFTVYERRHERTEQDHTLCNQGALGKRQ